MLPCHGCYVCGTWRSKEVGGWKLSYGGKGKSQKQEKLLWGTIRKLPKELTTDLLYLELPAYFILLWCKKNIYILHKILLTEVWINFSSWIFYLHYWFFINIGMASEWAFAFLDTVVIIICLLCSWNVNHSNQNPSFFSCARSRIHLFKIQNSATFHYIVMTIVIGK